MTDENFDNSWLARDSLKTELELNVAGYRQEVKYT
jgi:hypothetical protein